MHVWTDDVKSKSKSSFGGNASAPSATSSSLTLTLSEGKSGHKVVPGSEQEQATMFRTALGANSGGVVCAVQVKNIATASKNLEHQRSNVVICVKKVCDFLNQILLKTTKKSLNLTSDSVVIYIFFLLQLNPTSNINTKNGPKARRIITVFDAHGQDAALTLWGDEMCNTADSWTPMETSNLDIQSRQGPWRLDTLELTNA